MCISSLGGFRKEYRQQIPPPEWAERAAHVTDTLLQASREVTNSQQDRRFPRARSQLPALHPQPQHGPFSSGTAQPWVSCWHLPRMLIWHVGTSEVVRAWEGQTPKALAVQLGVQFREERICTLEYNVRTNLGLQQSVLTGAYGNAISEVDFSL